MTIDRGSHFRICFNGNQGEEDLLVKVQDYQNEGGTVWFRLEKLFDFMEDRVVTNGGTVRLPAIVLSNAPIFEPWNTDAAEEFILERTEVNTATVQMQNPDDFLEIQGVQHTVAHETTRAPEATIAPVETTRAPGVTIQEDHGHTVEPTPTNAPAGVVINDAFIAALQHTRDQQTDHNVLLDLDNRVAAMGIIVENGRYINPENVVDTVEEESAMEADHLSLNVNHTIRNAMERLAGRPTLFSFGNAGAQPMTGVEHQGLVNADTQVVEEPQPEPEPVRRQFGVNLVHRGPARESIPNQSSIGVGEGSMKNIAMIGEEATAELYQIFDTSIKELGHLVFEKIPTELQATLIEMKINHTLEHREMELLPGKIYRLQNSQLDETLMLIHDNHWYKLVDRTEAQEGETDEAQTEAETATPESRWFAPGDIGKISPAFAEEFYKSLKITEVTEQTVKDQFMADLEEMGMNHNEVVSNHAPHKVLTLEIDRREDKITPEELGASWWKAIEYFYITEGKLPENAVMLDFENLDTDGIMTSQAGYRIANGNADDIDTEIFRLAESRDDTRRAS